MDEGLTRNQAFPQTRWSLVARASDEAPDNRRVALEELCQFYWPPIYAFIRSKGASASEAEDLTQGFFAEFLSRDNFSKADEERGKLRTFLLRSVSNFMAQDWRDRNRLKRGGGTEVVSLDLTFDDGSDAVIEPENNLTPETLYQRQWAMTVLNNVVEVLREKYEEKDQSSLFESLRFVIAPGSESTPYSEVAKKEGMSESAVKVAAHRLRERYGKQLRETIGDTIGPDQDVEAEIRELMAAFG